MVRTITQGVKALAHELTIRENGKVEMAFAGEVPWHGLGTELQRGAAIEQWIEAAGMDWRVLRARVRYAVARGEGPDAWREYGEGEGKDWTGQVVLFRDDTKAPVGIVSSSYNVVQPREVIEFFRDLTGAAGMELETAGTLFGGKKLWAMATLNDPQSIADKRDTVKCNLLLSTSLDGSMATEAAWIATRVVCNNTLRISQDEGDAIRVKVNHRSTFDPAKVKGELGIEQAESAFDRTCRQMRELADKRMRESDVVQQTARLFYPSYDDMTTDEQAKVWRKKPVETVSRLTLDRGALGSEFDGTDGTAWQWLNSATQYIDHQAGKANTTADNRINSAWFGKGAAQKERAFTMARDYVPSLDGLIASINSMKPAPRGDGELLDRDDDTNPM